jgi:hypothetical protein
VRTFYATLLVLLPAAAWACVVAADLRRGTLVRDDRRMMMMAVIAIGTMDVAVVIMVVVVIAAGAVNMGRLASRLPRRLGIAHRILLLRP